MPLRRPEPFIEGLVPTLNRRGFMADSLDRYSEAFVEFAASQAGEVLDMGCAYGIATRAVLERGARVLACDMEPGHLEILEAETPPALRERLRTIVGTLPSVDFAEASFAAILCSRVVHFLLPDELRASLRAMREWLKPGGRLFVIADSPYTGFWSTASADYERRKAAGEEFPCFIADIGTFFRGGRVPEGMLGYLNPMDPETLRREVEAAGLVAEESGYAGRRADGSDGRNHAGVIARRPG